MAVKGAMAKQVIIDKLKETFGSDFVGVSDNKVYVWAQDGAEKVQIAISMTCPKNPLGAANAGIDFDAIGNTTNNADNAMPFGNYQPAQMDETELNNVRKMIAELGL